jgi:hypothetical protein
MLLVTWLSTIGEQGSHVINCVYTVGMCRAGWDCAFGVSASVISAKLVDLFLCRH